MTSLKHVGIQVHPADVVDFYVEILNGQLSGNHQIEAEQSNLLFQINNDVKITYVQIGSFTLELFLLKQEAKPSFQHICIETELHKSMYESAVERGYEGFSYGNELSRTYFIKDKAQNVFELKQR